MTRTDRIFAIVMTLAMLGALLVAAGMAFDFWNGMQAELDPAATVPMILGIALSLVVGAIVVGVYFYGRRREIAESER